MQHDQHPILFGYPQRLENAAIVQAKTPVVSGEDLHRGDVVSHTTDVCHVVLPGKGVSCQLIVIWHPTAIAQGYTPVVHAHTAQVAATVTEFLQKINPATGAVVEENPKFLKVGDSMPGWEKFSFVDLGEI